MTTYTYFVEHLECSFACSATVTQKLIALFYFLRATVGGYGIGTVGIGAKAIERE
jgi:hypothetical protein